MIKRLYVHNFRSFVNFEWKPPPACVLVGPNGAGKSSIFEVLWLLQDIVVDGRRADETWLESTATAWLKEPQQIVEVELEHLGESFHYRLVCTRGGTGSSLREELLSQGGVLYSSDLGKASLFGDRPELEPMTVPFDRRRSFLAVVEPRADNKRIIAFRDAIRAMWIIKPDPLRIAGLAQGESRTLQKDLSNFANWYRAQVPEDPDASEKMRADLRVVLPGFQLLRLEPITPEFKDLRARFDFGGKSHELPWAKLSDGQRQLIALYGLLRFGLTKASLIALDEIENYVAPAEIQPWLMAVADLAAEGKRQLMVISHHPEAIDYLAADSVWRIWRDKEAGHTRIALLEPDRNAGESAYDLVKLGVGDV